MECLSKPHLHANASYAFKYVENALEMMVILPGNIRERLRHAGEELLCIPEDVIPESAKEDFIKIKNYLTKHKVAGGKVTGFYSTDVHATMARRRSQTAVTIAKKILDLHAKYLAEIEKEEHRNTNGILQ